MPPKTYRYSFNTGEVAPELWFRPDITAAYGACQHMFNMLPTPQGAATGRPGTTHIADVNQGYGPTNPLTIPLRSTPLESERPAPGIPAAVTDVTLRNKPGRCFAFPAGDVSYTVLLTSNDNTGATPGSTLRVYNRLDGRLVHAQSTLWTKDMLEGIRTRHVNDILYIFSRQVRPKRLARYSDTYWELQDVRLFGGPYLPADSDEQIRLGISVWNVAETYAEGDLACDEDKIYKAQGPTTGDRPRDNPSDWLPEVLLTDTVLTVDVPADTDGSIADIGRTIRISQGQDKLIRTEWGSGASEGSILGPIPVNDAATVTTSGIWAGDIELQLSPDDGITWETLVTLSAEGNKNFDNRVVTGDLGGLARIRLARRAAATGDNGLDITLSAPGVQQAYVEITGYSSATWTVKLLTPVLYNRDTTDWAFSAFDPVRGWPGMGTFFRKRLYLASGPLSGLTFYSSAIDDFEDFRLGVNPDNAQEFTLDSTSRAEITWMVPLRELVIGTDTGIHVVQPAAADARLVSLYGSSAVDAAVSDESIYYAARGGRSIIRLTYNNETVSQDMLIGSDATAFSPHLFRHFEPVQMVWANIPYPTLLIVRRDGTLVTHTINVEQQVRAWSRASIGHLIDVAVNRSAGTGDDVNLLTYPGGDSGTLQLLSLRSTNPDLDGMHSLNVFEGDAAEGIYLPGDIRAVEYSGYDAIGSGLPAECVGPAVFVRFHTAPVGDIMYEDNRFLLPVSEDGRTFWLNRTTYPTGTPEYPSVFEDGVARTPITDYIRLTPRVIRFADPTAAYDVTTSEGLNAGIISPVRGKDLCILAPGGYSVTGIDESDWEEITPWQVCFPQLPDILDDAGVADGRATAGIAYTSLLDTTDLIGGPDMGGPGRTCRATRCELYLVDTLAGEVSTDQESYDEILQNDSTQFIGQALPVFTGKQVIPSVHGWTHDQGLIVTIRKSGPDKITAAAIGITVVAED